MTTPHTQQYLLIGQVGDISIAIPSNAPDDISTIRAITPQIQIDITVNWGAMDDEGSLPVTYTTSNHEDSHDVDEQMVIAICTTAVNYMLEAAIEHANPSLHTQDHSNE